MRASFGSPPRLVGYSLQLPGSSSLTYSGLKVGREGRRAERDGFELFAAELAVPVYRYLDSPEILKFAKVKSVLKSTVRCWLVGSRFNVNL